VEHSGGERARHGARRCVEVVRRQESTGDVLPDQGGGVGWNVVGRRVDAGSLSH